MKTFKVDFGSEQYNQCLHIRREVFIKEQNVPEQIEIDEYEARCEYFVTSNKLGIAVSTGRLRVKAPFIKFERIATLKDYRGKGFAKELMLFMQKYAQEFYTELTPMMHSQSEAVDFYKKLGWETTGPQFLEAGISHYKMVKT